MAFCAHIANKDTGLPAYTTKQFQECNILNRKPRKALNIDKLITVLLQIANRGKWKQNNSEATPAQSELHDSWLSLILREKNDFLCTHS